jgi:uncharacterized membrane protein YkoI
MTHKKSFQGGFTMGFKNTLKKVWIPVIAGSFVLMSFVAVQARDNKPQQPGSDAKGSVFVGEEQEGEFQENMALVSSAKISMEQAVNAAKVAYPDYKAVGTTLENENGFLMYAVQMVDDSGKALNVKVDAGNAKVLAAGKSFYGHEKGDEYENEWGNDRDQEDNDTY